MRLFVAAPLPGFLIEDLQVLRRSLQSAGLKARWVPPDNMHLTLKFLGEVGSQQLPSLGDTIHAAATGIPPITLVAKGIGGFPNLRHCRVLWVGLDGETQRLTALQQRLSAQLQSLGFPRERRAYHPHLTLARTRAPLDARHWVEPFADWTSQTMTIDQLALFASELKPTGAEYRCLHRATLTGSIHPRGHPGD
ncbi:MULTISPECIES: RNA 2',3'-cyclic phosphodiesterase [Thiorhodovibrio]|uniref:RNA 2',3'-cyclic phosphodiesterase n=1 Tax=Thiorhodovibrio TaxID=61593 RepID=UPI0019132931|nr:MULTISPECIES: RNA 2',3'-cyclic phosphodiesterase [Thiorhodovibrio]MBK5969651.1 2'-5' RNA ligase [Thiorhodovibrio winogradskyi]WPL12282.1 2'-5'-RNA ligase [Thiorhodovibrio litoralis]